MHTELHKRDHASHLMARRADIESAMARHLAPSDDPVSDQDRFAAGQLLDALLGAIDGSPQGGLIDDPKLRPYVGRFGDGLSPVLKDVFGAEVPEDFVARCIDRYWANFSQPAA